MRAQINNELRYFQWLCNFVTNEKYRVGRYEHLLRSLLYKPFKCFVPNDDNRATDGLELRGTFENEYGIEVLLEDATSYILYDECSILEMLIALSRKMAYITFDPIRENEPNVAESFWTMITNLNLRPDDPENDNKIRALLDRTYMENGHGGLFPLKKYREDQRQVEIWYQMMAYIAEN